MKLAAERSQTWGWWQCPAHSLGPCARLCLAVVLFAGIRGADFIAVEGAAVEHFAGGLALGRHRVPVHTQQVLKLSHFNAQRVGATQFQMTPCLQLATAADRMT